VVTIEEARRCARSPDPSGVGAIGKGKEVRMAERSGTWYVSLVDRGFRAALFDLDGVLTPTALLHQEAWRSLFDRFFAARGITPAYGDADYFEHIDGRGRYDAVRATLASRRVSLPEGSPADAPGADTICGLGNLKDESFTAALTRDGIEAYPGSVALIDTLVALDVPRAVVSSSRNAMPVLEAAGLKDRFPVIVDGIVADVEELAGKPAPDMFLRAARALDADPGATVVVEDALSGVAAGKSGGFGLVIGVNRGAGEEDLRAAGADVVVADLAELAAS
jgi:HAD superfamily hydrolase (TIGR01509 family)